jgi:hypothetical protein
MASYIMCIAVFKSRELSWTANKYDRELPTIIYISLLYVWCGVK